MALARLAARGALCLGVLSVTSAAAHAKLPAPSEYLARCDALVAAQAREAQKGRHLPASFAVKRWAGQPPGEATTADEERLVGALLKGEVRHVLVEGRGGLGKSTLVRALEARLCGELLIFDLDMREDVLPALGAGAVTEEPLLEALRRRLGSGDEGFESPDIGALVGSGPWLLFVDSLDEATRAERQAVLALLSALLARRPGARVVLFSRAPIFDAVERLETFDTRLEIQLLPCEVATRWIDEGLAQPGLSKGFWERAARTGLSRRIELAGRCVFPHLATFRDIKIASFAARPGGASSAASARPPAGPATRAAIYEEAVADLLYRSRLDLPLPVDVVLESIDRMVTALAPRSEHHELLFGMDGCLRALPKELGAVGERHCHALFWTALFERVRGAERWRFRNRSLTDLFVARFLDRQLAAGARKGGPHCTGLARLSGFFEAQEVSSFLVGLPHGSQCLGPLVSALCAEGCRPEDGALLLDQGIAAGDGRPGVLATARAGAGGSPCAQSMLDALAAIPFALEPPHAAP